MFTTVGSLAWLAVLPLLGAMYLMRPRPRQLPVGTMRFWTEAAPPTRGRIAWGKLRDPLSLAALALAVGLIVLSLAGFRFTEDQGYRKLVVILDNSRTMQAKDDIEPRFARAQAVARQVVNNAPTGCVISLVTAARPTEVALGWGDDPSAVVSAINHTAVSDSTRDLIAATELGKQLLGGDVQGHLVIVSDGCASVAADGRTTHYAVGNPADNLAITAFEPRRLTSGGTEYEMFLQVANASSQAAQVTLEITLDGQIIEGIPLRIAAEGTWQKIIPAKSSVGGRLHAELKKMNFVDALAVDDHAFAILPAPQPMKIALIPSGNFLGDNLLRTALEELPFVSKPLRVVTQLEQPGMQPGEVLVCHRRVPGQLPPCPVLVIDPESAGAYWKIGAPIAEPEVRVDYPNPVTQAVTWPLGALGKPRALQELPTSRVIAKATSGETILLEEERSVGRVLVLAASMEQGSLRFHGSLLVLLGNMLQRLAPNQSQEAKSLLIGDVHEIEVPANTDVLISSPVGQRERKNSSASPQMSIGPLNQNGFWMAQAEGKTIWQGAPAPASQEHAALKPLYGKKTDILFTSRMPLTSWLMGLAVVLLGLEWLAYSKGWTG